MIDRVIAIIAVYDLSLGAGCQEPCHAWSFGQQPEAFSASDRGGHGEAHARGRHANDHHASGHRATGHRASDRHASGSRAVVVVHSAAVPAHSKVHRRNTPVGVF